MSAESVAFAGDTLLKLSEVCQRTAMGKTSIYRKIEKGEFPAPVQISPKMVRWKKSEIDAWIASLSKVAA